MPVFLDTFADMDRGYFVRNGLVDRQYNPRAAGWVFRHQQRALAALPHLAFQSDQRVDGLRQLQAVGGTASDPAAAALLLPEADGTAQRAHLPECFAPLAGAPMRQVPLFQVDLVSGVVTHVVLDREAQLACRLEVRQPTLLLGGGAAARLLVAE